MDQAHYGEWKSPLSAEFIAKGAKRLGTIVLDGDSIYWDELRSEEGGRMTLLRSYKEETLEVLPAPYSVRTRVYEYGGGAYTVHNGVIYFVNDTDQRIYTQKEGKITPLTSEGVHYADLHHTPFGLVAVAEKGKENYLALIDLKTGKETPLVSGSDFYSSPELSLDGKKLAWLSWNHPDMPWDGTELWSADFVGGKLIDARKVAGGKTESIFQPQWGPDGSLYYVSDKTGWWNLYREGKNLCPMQAEFGMPQWVFDMSTYAFSGNTIICSYFEKGSRKLASLDLKTHQLQPIALSDTFFNQIRAKEGFAVFIAGSPTTPRAIVKLDLKTLKTTTLSSQEKLPIDPSYISSATLLSYPSKGGRTAYAFYYPPKNPSYSAPKGELPPLLVKSHGGPTANTENVLELGIQYWTSRGFAVLDVNYGGSTGFGRAYRDLLKGEWGVVDVDDCEYGAKYLVEKGLADPKKLAIAGGSAGGYTTLCALTFRHIFTAGASYFGVSDLETMTKDTHKFEAHYLDQLVGPYPEQRDLYKARSPIHFVDNLKCPVIFFQGNEDKIVPPDQSEKMFHALKKKGVRTEFILYEGEQHGFRRAENIQDALEKELQFYLSVFSHPA